MVPSEYNPVNDTGNSSSSSLSSQQMLEESDSEGGNTAAWLIPLIGTFVVGLINQWQENQRANQQQEFSLEMYNKQVKDNLNLWNLNNAYNSAAAQKQRLSEAGMNSLYYGLQNGGSPAEGGQPLGYERADLPFENPLVETAKIENLQANTAKTKSETDSTVLDNEFKTRTMNLRVEGVALANSLTGRQISEIDDKRKEIAANIKLLTEQATTEEVKRDLLHAEEAVKKAEAQRIVEMLPFEKALAEAQSTNQRAQASMAFWSAAIQKGLFEGGIVDYEIEKTITAIQKEEAETRSTERDIAIKDKEAALLDLSLRIKRGEAIDVDSLPKWMLRDRAAATLWNALLQRGNEVSTALGGVLGPVLGYAAGKGVSAANAVKGSTSVPLIYGPDGKPVVKN